MSLLTMSAQLAEGFLITVEIFVLTLLFSASSWVDRSASEECRDVR